MTARFVHGMKGAMGATVSPVKYRFKPVQRPRARPSLSLICLCLYFVTKPFYLWDSGLPQIADCVMLVFISHRLLSRVRTEHGGAPRSALKGLAIGFVYWTVVVNLFAILVVGESSQFVLASLINIYNVTVLLVVADYARQCGRNSFVTIHYAAGISVLIQAALVVTSGVSGFVRGTGMFNNPNQLALHGLLIMSILVICHDMVRPPMWRTCLGIGAALACVGLSLSRAGFIGAAIILIGILLWPPVDVRDRIRFRLVVLGLLAGLAWFVTNADHVVGLGLVESLSARAEKEDVGGFQAARGYDRVLEFPEYWLFGAGEGAYWRFGATSELHSTMANLMVSYGIVGLLLYLGVVLTAFREGSFRLFYCFLGFLSYGLAHNGLRSTLSWVMLALVASHHTVSMNSYSWKPKRHGERRKDE